MESRNSVKTDSFDDKQIASFLNEGIDQVRDLCDTMWGTCYSEAFDTV